METAIPKIDAELLAGLKNDQPGAFENLFDQYWKALYERAYRHFRDQSEAEDMVQDIFASIWDRRYTINITTSIQNYLQTALKYQMIRKTSRANLHEQAVKHLLYRMEEMEETILDVLMAEEIRHTLDQAIKTFPENMQQIFLLRTENYTIREIAQALGLAEQTVKNNNSEALKRLKYIVTQKHPDVNKSFFTLLVLLMIN